MRREQQIQRSNAVRAEEQRRADLASVLGSPAGRRFLWNLIEERCGYSRKFTAGPSELMALGRRSVAVELLEDARAWHPRLWLQMWTEAGTGLVEEAVQQAAPPPKEDEADE